MVSIRVLAGIVTLALLLAGTVGCEGPPTRDVSTSSLGAPPSRSNDPIVRNWPEGLAAIVVDQGDQLVVVDEHGIVFREVSPPLTVMSRDEQSPTFSFALSNNREYIAYLASGDRLVVRRTATGQEVGSVKVEPMNEMVVAAVSDDASRAVLISSAADPGQYHTGMLPQSVSLCDLRGGSSSVSSLLSAYATDAARCIYKGYLQPISAHFLPDDRLLFCRRFSPAEVVEYSQEEEALQRVEGLDRVWAVSASGAVLGAVERREGPGGQVTPVVWADGDVSGVTKPAVFEEGLPGWSGAISSDGLVVAVPVGGHLPQTLLWQAFRRLDDRWQPLGRTVETPENWVQMSPCAVSPRGDLIWGLWASAPPGSRTPSRQHPVSADTNTGQWTFWLQEQDLLVPAEEFDVVALVPAS